MYECDPAGIAGAVLPLRLTTLSLNSVTEPVLLLFYLPDSQCLTVAPHTVGLIAVIFKAAPVCICLLVHCFIYIVSGLGHHAWCYAMLCYAMLCYAMLCYAMPHSNLLYGSVSESHPAIACCALLHVKVPPYITLPSDLSSITPGCI